MTTTNLGGPRTGNCRARSFVAAGDFETRDHKDLGVLPWADLIAFIEQLGGTRPTFDLFDVPQADGTVLRYRAVNEEYQP
jgi:hypothetical protein